jgi:hypothetical protein
MLGDVARWLARARFLQRSLETLLVAPENTLLILPSTRLALRLARQLCDLRTCRVTAGAVTGDPSWRLAPHTRSPHEIVLSCTDFAELQCLVISFPDQLVGHQASFCRHPFLGSTHWFSTVEATLAMHHRPRVYAMRGLGLTQVEYDDARSLPEVMRCLLRPLEEELAHPPVDWLAASCLAQKSDRGVRVRLRDELKEIECLLRLHARSVGCDRLGTSTAIAAVVAYEKLLS